MNMTDLQPAQIEALLELAVLGMYVDGHLASSEDRRVRQLADAMPLETDYDREQFVDGVFTRVSRTGTNEGALRVRAAAAAERFPEASSRRLALSTLKDMLASGAEISERERSYLAIVTAAFRE